MYLTAIKTNFLPSVVLVDRCVFNPWVILIMYQQNYDYARIGRNDFQFNYRSNWTNYRQNTSRWYKYKEVRRPRKKHHQRHGVPSAPTVTYHRHDTRQPKSQTDKSLLGTPNQSPYEFRFPNNLTITVPNFSGLSPQRVFRFRNSPAKSAQFNSYQTGALPLSSSCHTENKRIRENSLNSKESETDDDVQYLYTVQAKGDELVKVIDLSEDSDYPSCSRESRISDCNIALNASGSGIKRKVLNEESNSHSAKQDAARSTGRKRKKSSEDLHCDICDCNYESIRNQGEEIYRARCGHMFCQLCLNGLNPYKCPECNTFLHILLKVFF